MVVGAQQRVKRLMGIQEVDRFRLSFGSSGDFRLGCSTGPVKVLLVGDSHAGHLQHGLDIVLRERGLAGYSINRSNTALFDGRQLDAKYVLEMVEQLPEDACVIVAQRWAGYYSRLNQEMFTQLESFVREIKARGKNVLITTDVANYAYSPSAIAARLKLWTPRHMNPQWNTFSLSERDYTQSQGMINAGLLAVCEKTRSTLVPIHLSLKNDDCYIAFACQGEKCVPLYRDEDHLTRSGSLLVAQFLLQYLNVICKETPM